MPVKRIKSSIRPLATGKRVRSIKVPQDISEQSQLSGIVFSKRFKSRAKVSSVRISDSFARGTKAYSRAKLASRVASDSDGSPTVGDNYIRIEIDSSHANAGSDASKILMRFGDSKQIGLLGFATTKFPKGATMKWDLNGVQDLLETIATDLWDEITLENPSGDGIKIDNIEIVHSDVTILDWDCNAWLDGSKGEKHGRLGLAAKILEKKLDAIDNNWIPQIHWAARELGKADGTKYGSTGAWCSEFASWALRKALWETPPGNIGSQSMENYFDGIGRKFSIAEVLNGDYVLNPGDYVRFQWASGGQHSGIFMEYIDSSSSPTTSTRIRTIEGNTGSTVKVRTRDFGDVISVGNTR